MIEFIRSELREYAEVPRGHEPDAAQRAMMIFGAVWGAAVLIGIAIVGVVMVAAAVWLLLQVSGWLVLMALLVLGTAAWIGMWA